MPLPIYQGGEPPVAWAPDAHRGLLFERFYDRYEDGFTELSSKRRDTETEDKLYWLREFEGRPCGERDALREHALRISGLAEALGGSGRVLQSDWRFATGLGLAHPVENGLAWHPTLGVPYLPGSGVKGLLSTWVKSWDGDARDPRSAWFGGPDAAGSLIFFDAVPIQPVRLEVDVMTPHMKDWYAQGAQVAEPFWEENNRDRLPADWHNPVPVAFLTVAPDVPFLFTVAATRRSNESDASAALDALAEALDVLGAGAKTAVGYGRMVAPDSSPLEGWRAEHREAEALAEMSPLEREIQEFLATRPNQSVAPYLSLLNELDRGGWPEHRKEVAALLRSLMEEAGAWRVEEYSGSNRRRVKDHKRTLRVLSILESD